MNFQRSLEKAVYALLFIFALYSVKAQQEVDVLIVGGGAGGTSAGIQSARMGVRTLILEKTSWLGGMLTSAGVSAIDGNHELPSGIWGEFREKLRDHYGGPKALATGWVSHTLFEPSIGNKVLQQMAKLPNLYIKFNSVYTNIEKEGQGWSISYIQNKRSHTVKAKILIDATEIGELLPIVGADFRLGMDSKKQTAEKEAPEVANSIVQDITYVLILEDINTKKGKKGLVKKPKDYNPKAYECACKRIGGEMYGGVSNCRQMLNYGKLPNNKYMINWPNCGNDFYLNWPELSLEERQEKLKEAKAFTQGFVYYIQNQLGYKNLRVAEEFPTKDNFPMIPYEREARRVRGKVFLTTDHLERPYKFNVYRTGIAVGDYPIDHHHDKNPNTPKIQFINIKVPSYNVPLGSIIPERTENFIVAEKNISVSNIVNGATRLQPVVLGIGQAAGVLAALAVKKKINPSKVAVRDVQQYLLNAKSYIMPFIDTKVSDSAFGAMQRIGATGILKGVGVPYRWANQMWFYPKQIVSEYELIQGLKPYYPKLVIKINASGDGVTLKFFEKVMNTVQGDFNLNVLKTSWQSMDLNQEYNELEHLNRRTVSVLLDKFLNPFEENIDHNGNLKKRK